MSVGKITSYSLLTAFLLAILFLVTTTISTKKESQKQMNNNDHKITFLKDYTSSPFLIESANLQFTLDPKETTVNAKLLIKRNSASKDKSITLDGENLKLQSIKINDKTLSNDSYKITPEQLIISKVPDEFTLETTVTINPEKNLTLNGLYLSDGNFCTQNEPHGFRHITYFLDRPDVLTKFTATIIADKTEYPVLLSNGNLITKKELPDNLHSATWQDPFPKSAYLFALVAGDFGFIEDYYTTTSGRKITLRIFAQSEQLDQCHHAMSALKQAMAWDERTFGLEYDLDIYQIVAVNDFNMGAMENKSLNIFNSALLLASPTTATDADFNRIASVVAHEYFHNWTGNRVTCRDWFQIGLKEGLTTLREQLFMEDVYGQTINRIDSIQTIRTRQFSEDAGPLSHPIRLQSYIEVNNFYTTTVYEKSAEVARMLCTIFGRTTFQQIIKEFLTKFDGQPATIEDFLQTAETVTKANLEQFRLWYDQAGTPTLSITEHFADDETYTLKIKQKHSEPKKDFYIPLAIGLVSTDGTNTPTETLIVDKNEQEFSFANFTTKPTPSLLRSFSAPIKIEYTYTDDELLSLMLYDQDPINAWDASQQLTTNIIQYLHEDFHREKPSTLPTNLTLAFKTIITDSKTNPALAAQMLQMPTESYLLETLPNANIEAIHQISEFIKLELAKKLKTELLECYKNNLDTKPHSLDTTSIGKRRLKNMCLYYLMYLNTQEIFDICLQQLNQADNLSDIQTCLTTLANSIHPKREQILNEYYEKWQDQPNLVNRWLAINANIKSPGTLQRLQKLMTHPAFNIKNPNKVYSLIRAFCANNPLNFHEANGAGYEFLTDQVIAIDKFNPQLAARIVTPLTQGDKLDKTRQQLMQQQLTRISQEPELSKNVYEIVKKALMK
jgi:aminopeptidase N